MASVIDICNLALGRLGDGANVSALTELSPQARHCARFYPIARDSLLEMHDWGFATRREALELLAEEPPFGWTYTYGCPANLLKIIAILPEDAPDDYSYPVGGVGAYTQQTYSVESNLVGDKVILANAELPNVRYIARVEDPARFSPLFVDALSWLLASYLAGPIYKGEAGVKVAQACLQSFGQIMPAAARSDANQGQTNIRQSPEWMAAR